MTDLYPFSTSLKVRFNETDAQGHVNFAWYLTYFDVALTEYLRSVGFSYQRMLDENIDMLYVDSHAAYKAPAHFDDTLRIHCCAGKIGNSSVRFDFQIFNETNSCLTANGEITIVMADHRTFQKMRIPDPFRQALEKEPQ